MKPVARILSSRVPVDRLEVVSLEVLEVEASGTTDLDVLWNAVQLRLRARHFRVSLASSRQPLPVL
jgi:hypothetical protein